MMRGLIGLLVACELITPYPCASPPGSGVTLRMSGISG